MTASDVHPAPGATVPEGRVAEGVAAAWMVLNDPAAQVNATTWKRQVPLYLAAVDAVLPADALGGAELAAVAADLAADGDRRAAHARVTDVVRRHVARADLASAEERLAAVAERGLTQLWLGGVPGAPQAPVRPADATPLDVAVVVPVRVREPARLRNVEVALRVLRRTLRPDDHVHVVLVEQDDEQRLPATVRELADDVVLAWNPGPFNKGWSVNLGVERTDEPTVCVLDGDYVLVRDALHRAVQDAADAAVAFPHTDAIWLDPASTDRVAASSVAPGLVAADVGPQQVTGYVLRDTLGLCLVVRRDLFDAVDGFDERYEGWGDEDNDLIRRLAELGPVVRADATGMHLDHPRPVMTDAEGVRPNKALVGTARPVDRPRRGDPDRYRRARPHAPSPDGTSAAARHETEARQP
ncbi:hypothetical protein Cch01nite_13300 [Cellulomonas chitinilytica]|uniref:Galactosyltransferase C-terminal domain-containing protein n=1 Tax=Cellulomonas chitinilytica TaxID=398759 RepID=A0A919NZL3_9CELL|nr:galactosyltransferase-related protein [Cellulomonas chitinilytica]GIG20606.1 hypothetical protein Cch01nite_13300 [Cellulomonas chitinilytica]